MRRSIGFAAAGFLLLAGCGSDFSEPSGETVAIDAVAETEMADATAASGGEAAEAPDGTRSAAGGEIPVSLPQIAYIYEYGFRIASDTIPVLQQQHADMCEKLGPRQCQIMSMSQSGGEGDYASGELRLAVAADKARAFGAQLGQAAEGAGGEQINASISGEDLSKQIVDTEARLRARTLLRDRLMEVLRSRKGTVAELVEAERGVAQVNEEIDQARSWLAEMKGRVAFSRVNVSYQSGTPTGGGFMEPIRTAFGSIGSILGMLIAALIVIATLAIPIGLLVWIALRLRRIWRNRRPAAETPTGGAGEAPSETSR